ncbi:MAG: hypothetical protein ACLUFV_10755 [Acutalibacteraceae bacterium]
MPNGALSNATIVNYSETGVRRLDLSSRSRMPATPSR